ncbi:MAG TPA: hypothetical protein VJQ45_04240 [Ktedonobacterales bacterium]|nr:hypothetical protein [Ktedonobacterales bacterium]
MHDDADVPLDVAIADESCVPRDDFPPFGYLDNPYHSWRLNPSGVLRSRPPAGMGWHVPNYGSYGRNQFQGRAHLHVGLEVGELALLQPADFRAAGVAVRCDLHTANRLRYVFEHPAGMRLAATYFLAGEHALGCRIELERMVVAAGGSDVAEPGVQPLAVRLWLAQEVTHDPTTSRDWEHGLYALPPGNPDPATGAAGLLGICPEGDAWAIGLAVAVVPAMDGEGRPADESAPSAPRERPADESAPTGVPPQSPPARAGETWVARSTLPEVAQDVQAVGADPALGGLVMPSETRATGDRWEAGAEDALPRGREPEQLQTAILALAYDLSLTPGVPVVLDAALSRGPNADRALERLRMGLADLPVALDARTAEDEAFWDNAPRLSGDWPAHLRRGVALDLETLRMVARPPAGIFAQRWDGMQIQAPRSVLAETALDALALSWADPALARELLLSCFAAAPASRPNVPCQREDASYNMVADDGSICGTGPEWGWPFAAIDALWRRCGDREWLAALYPRAAAYLSWWLSQRGDAEGWLVHACSWESGQDVSTRFGTQATGGSDIRSVRPVDLHATAAQAAALIAKWARVLELEAGESWRWASVAEDLAAKTRAMWRANWFHDYDAVAARWSKVRDPMQLAPLAAGLANAQQRAVLRRAFSALPRHCGSYPPLVWPPVAHTALEAALAAGLDARAAELAHALLDRTWRRMDARTIEPDGALPGVAREYWPEGGTSTSAGIEGYGWGALGVHFLIRYLLGLREETPSRLRLVPSLPPALRRRGAAYTAGPLPYGCHALTLTYAVGSEGDGVTVTLAVMNAVGPVVARDAATGRELSRAAPVGTDGECISLCWQGAWDRAVIVEIAAAEKAE